MFCLKICPCLKTAWPSVSASPCAKASNTKPTVVVKCGHGLEGLRQAQPLMAALVSHMQQCLHHHLLPRQQVRHHQFQVPATLSQLTVEWDVPAVGLRQMIMRSPTMFCLKICPCLKTAWPSVSASPCAKASNTKPTVVVKCGHGLEGLRQAQPLMAALVSHMQQCLHHHLPRHQVRHHHLQVRHHQF